MIRVQRVPERQLKRDGTGEMASKRIRVLTPCKRAPSSLSNHALVGTLRSAEGHGPG
jgi:hypothetical protein